MGTKRGTPKAARRTSRKRTTPGLADALFSKVQQRVLGVLFGNPSRSFYATEIIRLAHSGTGAVQRELARLQASGLVTVTQVGNQKHYQANASSPLFEEIRRLSLKTFALADVLRVALEPVAGEIRAAFVYGSIAKGTDTAASDIDVLVISDTLAYADLFRALERASEQLGRKVAPTIYSSKELHDRVRKENAFVKRVLAQPKVWLIGDEHTLGLGPEVWRVLDRAHSDRNRSEYEGDLSIDERLLADLIKACRTVLVSLRKLPQLRSAP